MDNTSQTVFSAAYNKFLTASLSKFQAATLASLLVAQAKVESANFTSNVFKVCNNIGGFKFVGQSGATAGIPANDGGVYAKYNSVADSASAMASWILKRLDSFRMVNSSQGYADAMAANDYFEPASEAADYAASMQRYYLPVSSYSLFPLGQYPLVVGSVVIGTIFIDKLLDALFT